MNAIAPLGNPGAGPWAWIDPGAGPADQCPDVGDYRHAVRIGSRWLLLPADRPAEVRAALQCTRLPFTRAWCLGLASFQGDPVPVYDPAALLAEQAPGGGGQFLVVGRRESRAALRIDEIAGLHVPPDAGTEPSSSWPGLPAELACNAVTVGETTYLELDLDALLGALAERASLVGTGTQSPRDNS